MANYSPAFPVNFTANGDTTSAAIWKHIQELLRVYSLLEYLDETKIGSGEVNDFLQGHINSTNPHPNWKPTINGSDIVGDIDAGKIVGDLTRATIHYSRVTELESYIQNLIGGAVGNLPTPVDKGDGIIQTQFDKERGFVIFKNGFTIQWGQTSAITGGDEQEHTYVFPMVFPNDCLNVTMTLGVDRGNYGDFVGHVIRFNKGGFTMARNSFPYSASGTTTTYFKAFGY